MPVPRPIRMRLAGNMRHALARWHTKDDWGSVVLVAGRRQVYRYGQSMFVSEPLFDALVQAALRGVGYTPSLMTELQRGWGRLERVGMMVSWHYCILVDSKTRPGRLPKPTPRPRRDRAA